MVYKKNSFFSILDLNHPSIYIGDRHLELTALFFPTYQTYIRLFQCPKPLLLLVSSCNKIIKNKKRCDNKSIQIRCGYWVCPSCTTLTATKLRKLKWHTINLYVHIARFIIFHHKQRTKRFSTTCLGCSDQSHEEQKRMWIIGFI